jgi:iron(III) transport system substrate-binding protein
MYLSLARQEGLISLWNLQDIMIQKVTNEQPFGYIMPKSGAPILVDGVAIVKGAKQERGAQDLMEFIFREDIRLGLAEETFQIPAMSGLDKAKMPSWLTDISVKPLDLDWGLLAENEMTWMEYWDQNIKGNG